MSWTFLLKVWPLFRCSPMAAFGCSLRLEVGRLSRRRNGQESCHSFLQLHPTYRCFPLESLLGNRDVLESGTHKVGACGRVDGLDITTINDYPAVRAPIKVRHFCIEPSLHELYGRAESDSRFFENEVDCVTLSFVVATRRILFVRLRKLSPRNLQQLFEELFSEWQDS